MIKKIMMLAETSISLRFILTLFRMGCFGAAHRWSGFLPKICQTYPAMMKLGPVIPYLKKIQKIYESCDTSRESC